MKILDLARNELLKLTRDHSTSLFEIRGAWQTHLVCRPSIDERVFDHTLLLVQTVDQGACYTHAPLALHLADILGQDARCLETGSYQLDIATLDSGYAVLQAPPDQIIVEQGTPTAKAALRAEIVVREANRLLRRGKLNSTKKPRAVVVGAIGEIIARLIQNDYTVTCTDLDPLIVGTVLAGTTILNGRRKTEDLVADSDVAIVTGMTLATGTLETILESAASSNTRIVMVAESASWLGRFYCDHLGVGAVVSEPYPFYIYTGHTRFLIYRSTLQ